MIEDLGVIFLTLPVCKSLVPYSHTTIQFYRVLFFKDWFIDELPALVRNGLVNGQLSKWQVCIYSTPPQSLPDPDS